MHLDASKFMKELAEQAHAIVLCGGTMSPVRSDVACFAVQHPFCHKIAVQVGDILSNVFPSMQSRVDFRSFGHVVPAESVLALFPPFSRRFPTAKVE
jgi:hypothetical protein